jgi:hypothetical protein
VDLLTLVGFIMAVGVALDTILKPEMRREIGKRIVGLKGTPDRNFDYIISSVTRYTSKNPTSKEFIFNSLKYSLISLFFILTFQIFVLRIDYNSILDGLSPSEKLINVFAMLFLFIFCLLIDYFSFLQTSVVLYFCRVSDKYYKIVILVIADIITTINLFTFLFSIALVFSYSLFMPLKYKDGFFVSIDQANVENITQFVNEQSGSDLTQINALREDIKWVVEFGSVGDSVLIKSKFVVLSKAELKKSELIDILGKFLDKFSEFSNVSPIEGSITENYYGQKLESSYSLRGSYDFSPSPMRNFFSWYSAAYLSVDAVQDNFTEIGTLSPHFQRFDSVPFSIGSQLHSELAQFKLDQQICLVFEKEVCQVYISNDPVKEFNSNLMLYRSLPPGIYPLFTLFYTSVVVTFIIYLNFMYFVIAKAIYISLKFCAINIEMYIAVDKFPFTFVSVILSVFYAIFYWVAEG